MSNASINGVSAGKGDGGNSVAGGVARLYVIHPFLKRVSGKQKPSRSPEARLAETVELARAIEVEVVGAALIPLSRVTPKTYIGGGKCAALQEKIAREAIEIVVCDTDLSPIQQRNLETALGCKVIDRIALILEIFGARANTKEGELQVDLAQLIYQRSRLVRSWTHLERQRGGRGFMGGPGERQIESDRRMIAARITQIKCQLEQVKRTRTLHRNTRQKAPYPVVALVGYTNVGKSMLFNALTKADVRVEDMLFATLDPTMRAITLGGGRKVILSDTVGFISELPHMLVAAFQATLEEVLSADIIVHVRDASDSDNPLQKTAVIEVLQELGLDISDNQAAVPIIEVMNKIDLLDEAERGALDKRVKRSSVPKVAVSALSGDGVDAVTESIDAIFSSANITVAVTVPYDAGAGRAFLHAHGKINAQKSTEEGDHYVVEIDPTRWGQYQKLYGDTVS